MNTYADKTSENKSQVVANDLPKMKVSGESNFHFVDNRAEATAQLRLQETFNNSPHVQRLKSFQATADSFTSKTAREKDNLEKDTPQGTVEPIQKKENNTGLPCNLKSGIENISGYAMDDVKVHYNSDKPTQLQARAYAQGTDIHLAPAQERHLPHEAWHVVQQKQGRVKPTILLKGKININDDTGLEKEADVMGAKALQLHTNNIDRLDASHSLSPEVVQCMVQVGKKNIKKTVLTVAINAGIRQSLVPEQYFTKGSGGRKDTLNEAGEKAIDALMETYSKITIHLNDFTSLIHQASQDLNMLVNGNNNLIGIGHQHSEFTYKTDRATTVRSGTPKKKDLTFKSGLAKKHHPDQRVYRTMTLTDWENSHISGHGGSIGQAMHYFNLGKKAHTKKGDRRPDLLVEFTFIGKSLEDLVSDIKGGAEGEKSTADNLGGKPEENTAFGWSENIFSVDLKNASELLNKDFVTARVLASTNGRMPAKTTKNATWLKRPG